MAWYLDPKHWKKGYALEAGLAVIDYIFNILKFKKLTAQINVKNSSSCHLAQKLGFSIEKTDFNSDLHGNKTDYYIFAIINSKLFKKELGND